MEDPHVGPATNHQGTLWSRRVPSPTLDVTRDPTVGPSLQAFHSAKLTAYSSTTIQGLLRFSRHDPTLLTTIEKTGVFETMFTPPARKAAYLILANGEEVAAFRDAYVQNGALRAGQQDHLRHIISSLDTAIQFNSAALPREGFLTATALSIKIFLEIVLTSTATTTTTPRPDAGKTAVQLMKVLQQPDQQLCSSLALCASLESRFWQTMMGAIAAPDGRTKPFYTARLARISVALTLTSWQDAAVTLQRFFWIPSLFSGPGSQVLSESWDAQKNVTSV